MSRPESDVFHLDLTAAVLDGAKLAIVPGDPARVARIAELLDDPVHVASNREFTTWRGTLDGHGVVVCSTGIGGPSVSIAVEELAQLGVRTFLRAGTTGAIQPGISPGDIIVTNGAVRLDGASRHFAPLEYPAVASHECTTALVEAARAAGIEPHVGITASSDTFCPGQERYDTYSGFVTARFRDSLAEWRALGVLNYEMESATLFTMCSALGLRAGCAAGVLVNRNDEEIPDESAAEAVEATSIGVVVDAARRLVTT